MAVIQISKIQVRRGYQEDLPQLASGEIGWSIDERRLFIGNGTLAEGAPEIGNTEILTSNQDIIAAINTYQFKGDESGYTSLTGLSVTNYTQRTLQHKLDEQISVRDFGAVGNGIADDTVALQRALNQTFPVSKITSPNVRRVLHIPAGTYLITSPLAIPPYAKILGDGIDATIIQQNGSYDAIIFADSLGQTGGAFGTSGATTPKYIDISGLTVTNTTANDCLVLDSVDSLVLNRVKLNGGVALPTTVGSATAGVRTVETIAACTQISLTECVFINNNYGVYAAGDVQQLIIGNSYFYNLYQGLVLTTDGAHVPVAVRTTANLFDKVANNGISATAGSSIVSAYNYFKDVGNGLAGTGNPLASIIYYEGPNNYSFGDSFDRPEADAAKFLRIQTEASLAQTVTTVSTLGTLKNSPGVTVTLTDNTTGNTGLTLGTYITSAIIDYSITRSNTAISSYTSRIGSINYVQNRGSVVFDEEYSESGTTGVTLSFVTYGANVALTYTSTASGNVAALNYQVRRFSSA